jgi:tetratricopeptide (TPR) repeat protein
VAYRVRKFVRRNRGSVIAASLVLVALLAGVIGTTWGLIRAETANAGLAAEQAKVQARFDLAVKAIETFHTGVSEDMLLKNPEFKELRTKLLKESAGFYADLEKLLAGQTDAKSRKALAVAYFQLGELTDKIGSSVDALAVHRKALALRRELAAAEGADVETRLDVARSLEKVGRLLRAMGDDIGALAAHEEQRELAERLEAQTPTAAVQSVLAGGHHNIGFVYLETGKPERALTAYGKALAILRKLADADPAVTAFQRDLSATHDHIGAVLLRLGKPAEALTATRKALAINQKLAQANPTVSEFQRALAIAHNNIAALLTDTGKPEEALASHRKALAIRQNLVDSYPAIMEFQNLLAASHDNIGLSLSKAGKPDEALLSHRKALSISQTLADANPTDPRYQLGLGSAHNNIGRLHACKKRFAEAFTALDAGLAICQKLAETDPKTTEYTTHLGYSHAYRGWALVRNGQVAQAGADLRRAVELWTKDSAPYPETRFERSRALALLAELGGDAKSGVTKMEARTFADQSVAALADAVKAGWALPGELKEPDFDALRGRADFQKLVAEVEAKAEKVPETATPPDKK